MTDSALPPMRFFTDQNVPDSVAKVLQAAGYEVTRLREKIATNSPDTLVAAVAEANAAILVTMDGDFKAISSRTGIGQSRYKKLSIIRFEKCRESQAAHRIRDALSLIEHEWRASRAEAGRRILIVISAGTIRTHR